MRRTSVSWLVAMLVALPAAAESRVRLENVTDPSARVNVGFADPGRSPATLRASAGGGAELLVEAPSPKRRLRGGTLRTDPAIDLLATKALREESRGPAVFVIPSHERSRPLAPADGPLVYDDWAAWWGAGTWGGGWYGTGVGSGRFDRGANHRGGESWRERPSRATASGGSFRASGVIARPGR